MSQYCVLREPPPNRRRHCEAGLERHLSEAAVMIAFAMYLFEQGAKEIELHPDGEHGKRFEMADCLNRLGFDRIKALGTTSYGGVYQRNSQLLTITLKPGLGDVVANIKDRTLIAECKGGVINSSHAGQLSRLRKGLCEAVGLLMTRPLLGERHIAVVPATLTTERVAVRLLARANTAGIEIALVDGDGNVQLARAI